MLAILFCSHPSVQAQTINDNDSNGYRTVQIDKQVWMLGNLDVSRFRNGDTIYQAKTADEWRMAALAGKPAWCHYNNDSAFGNTYGKLYNWYAVNDPRGLAPEGWRIPTSSDWSKLIALLGSVDIAGMKLKSTQGWKLNGNGNNKSGFTALPGGYRSENGVFAELLNKGQWWAASSNIGGTEQDYSILLDSGVEAIFMKVKKLSGFSVRCIKNSQ